MAFGVFCVEDDARFARTYLERLRPTGVFRKRKRRWRYGAGSTPEHTSSCKSSPTGGPTAGHLLRGKDWWEKSDRLYLFDLALT